MSPTLTDAQAQLANALRLVEQMENVSAEVLPRHFAVFSGLMRTYLKVIERSLENGVDINAPDPELVALMGDIRLLDLQLKTIFGAFATFKVGMR